MNTKKLMQDTKPKLICIVGPTSSGKTEWGIKLAKKFDGEIISADSRQIYKEMDIGTGKPCTSLGAGQSPDPENDQEKPQDKLIKGIPHYMIDVLKPDEEFSAAEFKKEAVKIINQIHKRKKTPFLVGGTGLYIKSVVENFQFPPEADLKLRKELTQKPLSELTTKLKKLDPESAKKMNLKNKRRVVRALETVISTGKPFAKQKSTSSPIYDTLQIGIKTSREELYGKIEKRIDKMIQKGLKSEVKRLVEKYGWNSILSETIGYQEWEGYFQDPKTGSEKKIIKQIKKNSRRYAKRQLTWFQKDKNIVWIEKFKKGEKLVDKHLQN